MSSMMSSCCGFRQKDKHGDTEALLSHYDGDASTALQRTVRPKMHTFQMLRALSLGYMPSTEQAIINLRTLLAADVLNPDNPDLSDSGILLVKYGRRWLQQFIELLRAKNNEDQIQEFIWCTSKSRFQVDAKKLARSASIAKEKADANAAYQSLFTIGNLLLTNSDFRLFLGDLGTISRQVFSDAAYSFSSVAKQAGDELEPSEQQTKNVQNAEAEPPPSTEDLEDGAKRMRRVLGQGMAKTGQDTVSSLKENVSGDQKNTLLQRLKETVLKLRKRPDYDDSVSIVGLLIKRYALAYSRAVDQTVQATKDSVDTNTELDNALKSLWSLMSSFGDQGEWKKLEEDLRKVAKHSQSDPEFEKLVTEISNFVQGLLRDPSFFDSVEQKFEELRDKINGTSSQSELVKDLEHTFQQIHPTLQSVLHDETVANLLATSSKLLQILSPKSEFVSKDLLQDLLQVFIPLVIQGIQYIPIPRLEISVPEIDLLLENIILEPGVTVNNTSFLPYKLLIQTQNDLEIRKAHTRHTTASTTNLVTIAINGLSLRAEELGFWLRAHKSIFRLGDEGIASFELDERGIDIALDIEIGKERLEKILTLKKVRVHVHKLNYQLRQSKLSWLAWLVKPIMRPIMRKVMEKQLATAIADGLHAANRELLFARERLRATRISDPQDIRTFIKAIITRLTPAEDPDMYTFVGVRPSQGVFKGVYAPGSLVKLWEDEARFAKDKVEDSEIARGGWKNEIFEVNTTAV